MKYIVIINDDELVANGDELELDDIRSEVGELLRSGYYEVESVSIL